MAKSKMAKGGDEAKQLRVKSAKKAPVTKVNFPKGASAVATSKLNIPKKGDDDAKTANEVPVKVNSNVTSCFPRGASTVTATHSSAKPAAAASQSSDNLFGKKRMSEGFSALKTKEKSKKAKVDTPADTTPDYISNVSAKHLCPGMLLLGTVQTIHDDKIIISIPNQLHGTVYLNDVSDEFTATKDKKLLPNLSDIFAIGQFIPCSVLRLEKGTKLEIVLSMRMSLFNVGLRSGGIQENMTLFGSIRSIEDHGLLVNVGNDAVTGFVPNSLFKSMDKKPQVGQIFFFLVTDINKDTRIVNLTFDPDAVLKTVTRGDAYSLDILFPGMLLNVKIVSVLENGVRVRMLSYFQGSVEQNHLGIPAHSGWKKFYETVSKARARIIAVNRREKTVLLSMAAHIVHLQIPEPERAIGDIIENATIHRIDNTTGMLISLGKCPVDDADDEAAQTRKVFEPAYVRKANVSDKLVDRLNKQFKLGDTCTCRVFSYAQFDGIAKVSMQASVLEQTVLGFEDIKLAQFLDGIIEKVTPKGIFVNLGYNLTGLIPTRNLPNLSLQQLQSKFKEGKSIRARVLQIDGAAKHVYLTIKRGIMESKIEPLISFESAKVGQVAVGTIVKIFDFGLLIAFYGNTTGFVQANELKEAGVESLSSSYAQGQIVKACVVERQISKKRLRLSLDLSNAMDTTQSNTEGPTIGEILSCVVESTENEFIRVKTSCGSVGTITHAHLTDYSSQVESSIEKYVVGTKIEKALVLSKRHSGLLILTLKPLLLNRLEQVPKTISDVTTGKQVIGYVHSINERLGANIRFIGDFQALILKRYLSDHFVSDPNEVLHLGDTVIGTAASIDADKKKFIMSLINTPEINCDVTYITGILQDRVQFSTFKLGSVHEAIVIGTRDYGTVVTLCEDSNISALLPPLMEYTEGNKIHVRLIDADAEKKIFYATSDAAVVKAATHKVKKYARNAKVQAKVLITRGDYAVVSMKNALGIVQLANFNCPKTTADDLDFSPGKSIELSVARLAGSTLPQFADFYLLTRVFELQSTINSTSSGLLPIYSSAEMKVGTLVECSVKQIKSDVLKLRLNVNRSFGSVDCMVSISEMDISHTADGVIEHPFDRFKCGQVVKGRLSHILPKNANELKKDEIAHHSVFVSLLKKDIDIFGAERLTWDSASLKEGAELRGVVEATVENGVRVQFSPLVRGFCHRLDLSDEIEKVRNFSEHFRIGTPITCRVIHLSRNQHYMSVVVRKVPKLAVGQIVNCMINRERPSFRAPCLMVDVGTRVSARVDITDLADKNEWIDLPITTGNMKGLEQGDIMKCMVVAVDGDRVDVSLQKSLLEDGKITECILPGKGDLVQGFITGTSAKGSFVQLSRSLQAHVKLRDLADEFIREPSKKFPVGRLVAGRVLSVHKDTKRIDLSLKPSIVSNLVVSQTEKFKVGQHVKGTVTNIREYGVFVKLEGTELQGLCHKSQLSDGKVDNPMGVYNTGDYVKAKILQLTGGKIALGLKPSYFVNDESSSGEDDSDGDDESNEDEVEQIQSVSDDESDEDEDEDEDEKTSEEEDETEETAAPEIRKTGISWDGFGLSTTKDDESSSSDEEVEKKSPRKKNKLAIEEEIRSRETKLMNGDSVPETADDFERLLVASPNSSFLWIKYISFHVSMTETDMARDVAERALKSIQARDEQEKFNIWVAYLNLENKYGDDITLEQVFRRAVQHNNPKKTYLQLYQIYDEAKDSKKAEATLKTIRKKFKTSKNAWLTSIRYYLEHKKSDKASDLLQQSLKSLAKHKHVPVISRFASYEYELGSPDRGRTLFEGILASYPKRLDLWNVYMDKEIKFVQDSEYIRVLFARVTNMKFSAKKMRFLFKKYIDYESEHGTEQTVQHVRELVQAFVESAADN